MTMMMVMMNFDNNNNNQISIMMMTMLMIIIIEDMVKKGTFVIWITFDSYDISKNLKNKVSS